MSVAGSVPRFLAAAQRLRWPDSRTRQLWRSTQLRTLLMAAIDSDRTGASGRSAKGLLVALFGRVSMPHFLASRLRRCLSKPSCWASNCQYASMN
ncbi:hypothetical protein ADK64_31745 [Streptomyces sp. MMG1121]|nr:hypothetical protein ADK64_31745 [Streptomyces sp. MMG1121]